MHIKSFFATASMANGINNDIDNTIDKTIDNMIRILFMVRTISASVSISLIAVVSVASSARALAKEHLVEMQSIRFSPRILEVAVGDEVQWHNTSLTDHSALFDKIEIMPVSFNKSWVHAGALSDKLKFLKPGEFAYHCALHGKTMSGIVVVKP